MSLILFQSVSISLCQHKCPITASGYEQKALVAQYAVTSPSTITEKLSR